MKLRCLLGVVAFTVGCGGASDSHNSSLAGASGRASGAGAEHERAVTLTGCLQNADRPDGESATGTSGSAASGSATPTGQTAAGRGSPGERFTLTHVSGGAAAKDAAPAYLLEGDLAALRAHVNHEVRVSGSLDVGAANTAGPERVRVDSVEQIGSTCDQQSR
jgi:hypothetical protein